MDQGAHVGSGDRPDPGRDVSADAGVDLVALDRWLDARSIGGVGATIGDVTVLHGGTQNVLLRVHRGSADVVVRRPPLHKRDNSDETMRREARVLRALAGSEVPHPALVDAEPDPSVLGAAFTVMQAVDGFNPAGGLPSPFDTDASWQRSMGLSMVDAIGALSTIDHVAAGLGDLGRWDGWGQRQVGRWRRQLESYSAFEGYGGPHLPGVDDIGRWLDERIPTDLRPGIVHGDFHFGNVLVRRDAPHLAAIVDWELATIGDPLLDLGHLLATWPGASDVAIGVAAPGLPDHATLVDRYSQRTGRPVDDVAWFRVLACFRLGLILEGTHARACAGLAPREIGDLLHAHTVSLLEQALGLIG